MAWFVSERQTWIVHGKLIKPSENQPDFKFKDNNLLWRVNDWSLFSRAQTLDKSPHALKVM